LPLKLCNSPFMIKYCGVLWANKSIFFGYQIGYFSTSFNSIPSHSLALAFFSTLSTEVPVSGFCCRN
jgi:hypothetical protein